VFDIVTHGEAAKLVERPWFRVSKREKYSTINAQYSIFK
jgi:hypothetical protein